MTTPPLAFFVAHITEPDGHKADCVIGAVPGTTVEEARRHFEEFLNGQDGTYVIRGFHELHPEPADEPSPAPSNLPPSAIAAAASKMALIMLGILALARLIARGMR